MTPGRWKVDSGSVCTESGIEIAHADRNEPRTRPVERDDNMRAIAAVPDMIEALKEVAGKEMDTLISMCKEGSDVYDVLTICRDKARIALTKAEVKP